MNHSVFNACGASRWSNCPGSLVLSQGMPRYGNAAISAGTAGHMLGEECLTDDTDPLDFIGRVIPVIEGGKLFAEIEVTVDLATAVQFYVDYVRGISGTRWLGTTINYAAQLGVPEDEGFGTCDACVLDGTTLHVVGAKFGRGYVDPVKNKQMILCTAGVVDALEALKLRVKAIKLHVVQPRVSDTTTPDEMTRIDFAHEVGSLRESARRAMEAASSFGSLEDTKWVEAYLNAGEYQCQWCPAAATCPALRHLMAEFTGAGGSGLN